MPCSALTRPASRRVTSCTAAGRCCRSAAFSATCRPRRWPRCRPTSAAATCGYSCWRCHRRPGLAGAVDRIALHQAAPSHSRIVPRPVGENLRVPGRISPMRAALHRRQAAGVSKAHRGDRPCTSTAAGHGNRDHHVRARARSGQHHGASRRAAAPRSVGRSSERGVAGRREGRRPAGRAACRAGNRRGPGEVCRVGGGRPEAADPGHQRPRRVQRAHTSTGEPNANGARRAPAPRYAAD